MSAAWAEKQNRDRIVRVRVTPTERDRLRAVALAHGTTQSEVIRQGVRLLLRDTNRPHVDLRREVIE